MTIEWKVTLWLGDQSDWFLQGLVTAPNEAAAISRARIAIGNAWPLLFELVECAPATASPVRTIERRAPPQPPAPLSKAQVDRDEKEAAKRARLKNAH